MNHFSSALMAMRPYSARLVGLWLFLAGPVLLFAPVQATLLFLLLSLSAAPFVSDLRGGLRQSRWILSLTGMFLAWSGLSALGLDHTDYTWNRIGKFLAGIPFAIILLNLDGRSLARYVDPFKPLLAGYLLAGLILAADRVSGLALSEQMHLWKGEGYVENMLKPGSSILLLLGVVLGFAAVPRGAKWWLPVLFLQIIMLPHLSVTHAAYLAIPFSLPMYALARSVPALSRWVLAGSGFLMVLAVPFLILPQNYEFLLEMGVSPPVSLMHRFVIWDFARELIAGQPWLGYGLGSASLLGQDAFATPDSLQGAFQSYERWLDYISTIDLALMPLHPHSLGLQIILETGLIGGGFFALLLASVGSSLLTSGNDRRRFVIFPAAMTFLLLAGFSFSIWHSWWLATMFLMTGLIRLLSLPAPDSRQD